MQSVLRNRQYGKRAYIMPLFLPILFITFSNIICSCAISNLNSAKNQMKDIKNVDAAGEQGVYLLRRVNKISSDNFIEGTPHKWNYKQVGEDWKEFSDNSNTRQSPIDLDASSNEFDISKKIKVHFTPCGEDESLMVKFENYSFNVYCLGKDGTNPAPQGFGYIEVDNVKMPVLQFHFHALAEHTFNTQRKPLELHIVCNDGNGGFIVLGLLFYIDNVPRDLSPGDEFISAVIDIVAKAKLSEDFTYYPPHPTTDTSKIDFQPLFANNSPILTYTGSLTTPPCRECVTWYVSKTHALVNEDLFLKLWSIFLSPETMGNFRLPQNAHNHHQVYSTVLVTE